MAYLEKANDPYYKEHFHILEQISQSESIALVVELPNVEAFTNKLFKSFYKIADKQQLVNVEIEYNLAKVLSTLTSELEILPAETVDIIFNHFLLTPPKVLSLKGTKSTKTPPSNSLGFQISTAICTDNIEIMIRHVNQYFSDIIATINLHESNSEKNGSTAKSSKKNIASNEKKKESQDRLLLLTEKLWTAVPELLATVINQLDQGLSVVDDGFREATVRSIGRMVGAYPGRVSFVKDHFPTWKNWLGRAIDKSSAIRIAWIQATPGILTNNPEVANDIAKLLSIKLEDPDEKVRAVTCAAIGKLSVKTIATKLGKSFSFNELFNRLRDMKPLVREEAFKTVGKLYKEAYPYVKDDIEPYIDIFAPIPQRVLDQVYVNDKKVDELIDICLNLSIFWPEKDDMSRAIRLLTIMSHLQEKGKNVFLAMIRRQFTLSKYLAGIVAMTKNKTSKNPQLNEIVKYIGSTFDNSSLAESFLLDTFQNAKNSESNIKNISMAINPESSYSVVNKAINEVLENEADTPYRHTATILLYRTAFWILNKSTIIPIIEISRNSSNKLSSTAGELLAYISESQPALMRNHVMELVAMIERGDLTTPGNTDALKAANLLAERFPDMIPENDLFYKSLVKFSTKGSVEEANEAIKLIHYSQEKEKYYTMVSEVVIEIEKSGDLLATHLAAISGLYKKMPSVVEKNSRAIFKSISDILFSTKTMAKPNDPVWIDQKELNIEGRAKIIALGIYVNRLLYALKTPTEIQSFANVVFTFLASTISNMGEIIKSGESVTPEYFQSHLRLEAGLQFLTIASHRTTQHMIRPQQVTQLAFIVQDNVPEVRKQFIQHLLQYWSSKVVPNRFLPLVFMTAFEKNREMYNYVTTWIRARSLRNHTKAREYPNANKSEHMSFELSFTSFIHMIVHHHHNIDDENHNKSSDSLSSIAAAATPGNVSDQSDEEDALQTEHKGLSYKEGEGEKLPRSLTVVARYILFYLSTVASEQNISLIYHLAGRVKYFQDSVDEKLSPQIYLVSEIAQLVIKKYLNLSGWQLSTWPGSSGVSSELFKIMDYSTKGKIVLNTTYFPPVYKKNMEDFVRKHYIKMRHHNVNSAEPLNNDEKNEDTSISHKTGARKSTKRNRASNTSSSTKRKRISAEFKQTSYGKKNLLEPESGNRRKSTRIAKNESVSYSLDDEDEEEDLDQDENENEDDSANESLSDLSSLSEEAMEQETLTKKAPKTLLKDKNGTSTKKNLNNFSDDSSDLPDLSDDLDEAEEMEEIEANVEKSISETKKAIASLKTKPGKRITRNIRTNGTTSHNKPKVPAKRALKPVPTPAVATRRRTRNSTQKETEARKLVDSSDAELSDLSSDSNLEDS